MNDVHVSKQHAPRRRHPAAADGQRMNLWIWRRMCGKRISWKFSERNIWTRSRRCDACQTKNKNFSKASTTRKHAELVLASADQQHQQHKPTIHSSQSSHSSRDKKAERLLGKRRASVRRERIKEERCEPLMVPQENFYSGPRPESSGAGPVPGLSGALEEGF